MWQVVGFILLPFALLLLAAANKAHKEETGVSMPSRGALKSMRRRARKKGVSEAEYYAGWVQRKQKREGVLPIAHSSPVPAARPPLLPPKLPKPERLRAPPHEPFDIEHLSMMAAGFGWTLRRQAFGMYYLVDRKGVPVANPYAAANDIATDFSREDLEDFLLTC
ncbi:hypothetical protein EDE08_101626 [Bradyrhizobium sp. R2.2-H]|jgi:hypothetical protein|uniref:hypothetical protein n=1 Tax=unclassified Bradyrhizobium TaxID=2631580 RepID=UPI001050020C|nr:MULTISPECIES: hypothetical protein [unclassified Bradyrhizobium]TCU78844.1 hypothetical protein EDE10_101627 [Bradyrhizobium sp. Y-H1]TCU80927.1 hypothetical protein EDE08_101626 [Bradyrhizobium sp. R2.2-H]